MPSSTLDRAVRWLETLLMLAAAASLLVLTFGTIYSVVTRYFFGIGTAWSIELGEYMVLFLGFLAAAAVDREDSHVSSSLLLDAMPRRIQGPVRLAGRVVVTATLAIFVAYAVPESYEYIQDGTIVYNALFIEKWLVYVPPTIGMLALVLRSLLKTVEIAANLWGAKP